MLLLLLTGADFTPAPTPTDVRGRAALHEEGAGANVETRAPVAQAAIVAGGASVGDE